MLLVLSPASRLLTSPHLWLPLSQERFWKHSWIFTRSYRGKGPSVPRALFPHFSPAGFLWGLTLPSKDIFQPLVLKVWSSEWARVEGIESKGHWSVQKSYLHSSEFFFILIPIFLRSSNRPAITLSLLCCRVRVIILFFSPSRRNTFSGYLTISVSVFDSARDKKHELFSPLPLSAVVWVSHSLLPAVTTAATYRRA